MTQVLQACLADDVQRAEIAQRIVRELMDDKLGSERVVFSVVRLVLHHREVDKVDWAFALAATDYRDLFMCAGHGGLHDHDVWAAEVLARPPQVVLQQTPPRPAEVSATGWVRCPQCDFKFKRTDPNAWDGKHHQRCGARLRLSSR